MNNLVSVIIPVYNTSLYLDEAIQSVVNQTYENIEIVLVDDGSTDSSGQICDKWCETDNRITVLHTTNNGPSTARNIGITHSKGDYILPVDGDDKIDSQYIEKAKSVMDADNSVGIVYCRAAKFGDESGEWLLQDYSIKEMLIHNCIFATAMFRRSDWELVGGYSSDMKKGIEDYDLWLSIISLKRKIYKIPEILFYYRKHKTSRTNRYESDKKNIIQTEKIMYSRHKNLYSYLYFIPDYKDKIVLYGAGGAGKTYFRFLNSIGSNNIIKWVDQSYERLMRDDYELPIDSPSVLYKNHENLVVVALNNKEEYLKIRKHLSENGYETDRVHWYIKEYALKEYEII